MKVMNEIIELSEKELLTVIGGASFAYRAGQVCAILWDFVEPTPGISTRGGIAAICDWFF